MDFVCEYDRENCKLTLVNVSNENSEISGKAQDESNVMSSGNSAKAQDSKYIAETIETIGELQVAVVGKTDKSLPEIAKAYLEYGNDIINHISGLYYIMVADSAKKCLCVYSDLMACGINLYYAELEGKIIFATSFGRICKMLPKRTLDDNAKIAMAKYGYVPGESTIVAEVKKVAPLHFLTVTGQSINQTAGNYELGQTSVAAATVNWNSNLEAAITSYMDDEIAMPLSGGYDSNYILYCLNKNTDKSVNLYSIGGQTGADETGYVREIAKHYNRHTLKIGFIAPNLTAKLQEIVERTEGQVFERGIFLQYMLASLVSKGGDKSLLCGEGADQIMDSKFADDVSRCLNGEYRGISNAYEFCAYVILRKSALMLKSFGIEGKYPYLDKNVIANSMALKDFNKSDKAFHKDNCRKLFDREVSKVIHKEGGATSFHSLFASESEADEFVASVEAGDYYKDIVGKTKLLPGGNDSGRMKKAVSQLGESAKKIVKMAGAGSLNTLLPAYRKKERQIRNALLVEYMRLTEETFVK